MKYALLLNIGFTLFEFIGGWWTNSMAIISEALHDFGDALSLGLSWYLEKVSRKPRTKAFTYGYKRFSLLGALINCLVLLGGSILIISEAANQVISLLPLL